MSKRVRWECPSCHERVLGPVRPRRDDVRRYCLVCSKRTGRLVERVAAVLEKRRHIRSMVRSARAQARRSELRKDALARKARAVVIGGLPIYPWIRSRKLGWPPGTRIRRTKGPGPLGGTHDAPILRYGDWADLHDGEALALVLGCWAHRYYQDGSHQYRRSFIRSYSQSILGVRPRLESLANAPVEIALLLRQKAAAKILGADRPLERRTAS